MFKASPPRGHSDCQTTTSAGPPPPQLHQQHNEPICVCFVYVCLKRSTEEWQELNDFGADPKRMNIAKKNAQNRVKKKTKAIKDLSCLLKDAMNLFGGNDESKKMQRNVLKHQFENFTTAPNESLDKAYDRFQKLISQLEVHAAPVSKEDIKRIVDPCYSSFYTNLSNYDLSVTSLFWPPEASQELLCYREYSAFYDTCINLNFKPNYTNNLDFSGSLFGQGQRSSTRTSWHGNMKGKDGIYTIGFTGEGLFGALVDAERVAVDIGMQWSSYREHLCLVSNLYRDELSKTLLILLFKQQLIVDFRDMPSNPTRVINQVEEVSSVKALKQDASNKERSLSAQTLAAKASRRKISEKTQELGKLIPDGQKMNTAEMFQAAFKYVSAGYPQVIHATKVSTIFVDDLAKISLTVYVSNFPSHFTIRELWNTCGKMGTLVDVYIAKHKNKLGQMFAFCRYIKVSNSETLINALSNVWIGNLRLHANVARFDRNVAVKTSHAGVKVDNLAGKNVRDASVPNNVMGSFASVLNKGNQFCTPPVHSSPALVLDDTCLTESDYSMVLMGKVKDVVAIPNLKFTLSKEGFQNLKLNYLGGLWVLFEFQSISSKDKFSKHYGVSSWFSSLKPTSSSFVSDERIVWVSIEGLPLFTRTKNTLSKIASKWGDLIDWEGHTENSFSYKRLCIKTKIDEIINKRFKIIVKGKVYWIRAKEMEA
ncbi:RNA-directed DNA polymerase, eukaryota, nucleotide-binding alpha-beta plait domain protein [Tanacetum coccineum]